MIVGHLPSPGTTSDLPDTGSPLPKTTIEDICLRVPNPKS